MRAAALWTLRLWCVVGWMVFVPLAAPRLLYTLLNAFGA